ncbi:ABC transporter substrate-binding protein [Paenibacillus sinopodophylli]|uniref:ABC transporter substrate-binding protein n=1 Tax=Paenibacillus sinopodophylli TaxID=1837342 RepID=UPI00110CC303|nr:ABC transporter substrate-binding protein [Paenibacillus sinopodophylli]
MMTKKWISLMTISLSVLLLVAGCQNGNSSSAVNSAEVQHKDDAAPMVGGELNFALSISIVNDILDPHQTGSPQNSRVQRNIFDSLIVELPDHTFAPWLAESWEVAEDGKSYTFKLRKDVKFHDGTSFNAEAVKFNFDRILNLKAPGAAFDNIGSYESSEVLDEFTVEINFKTPFAPFLGNLSGENLGIVSPAAVEKYGDAFIHNPIGTGPFKLASFTAGTEYVLERNPDYNWPPANAKHKGPAYLEKVIVKVITEEATRVGVLQSGDVQAADIIPPQNILSFQQDKNFQLQEAEPLGFNAAIALNVQKAPLNDLKLREALRTSLDLDTIVKTIYLGTHQRAYSSLSPSLFGYDASLESKWTSDPAAAADQLDALGWVKGSDGIREKGGKRLTVEMIDFYANREKRMDVMALVQNQWRQNGIELKITSLALGAYMERLKIGDFDLNMNSKYGADPDVARLALNPWVPNSFDPIQDDELQNLLRQGNSELDVENRKAIYSQIQHRIFDNVYSIPVYVFPYTVASTKALKDLSFDIHGFPLFYDAWLQK